MKIFLGVLVVLVLGFPLLGTLVKGEDTKQDTPPARTTEKSPSAEDSDAQEKTFAERMEQLRAQKKPSYQMPQPQQRPQARPRNPVPRPAPSSGKIPPLLNAQNLVNTVWQMKIENFNVQVQLFAGGMARATAVGLAMAVDGMWKVNGDSVVVSAMGKTANAKIVGDQLIVNGVPAKRIR